MKPWNSESVGVEQHQVGHARTRPRPRLPSAVTTAVRVPSPVRANECGPSRRQPYSSMDTRARSIVGWDVDEVPGQAQPELLDRADAVLAGEGVDGVLLRVGGQHGPVVAGQVGGGEVAGERDAHVEVGQRVLGAGPVAPGPAVPRPCRSCWVPARSAMSAPPVGRVAVRAQQQRHVVVAGRLGDEEHHASPRGRTADRAAVSKTRRYVPACHWSSGTQSRSRPSPSVMPAAISTQPPSCSQLQPHRHARRRLTRAGVEHMRRQAHAASSARGQSVQQLGHPQADDAAQFAPDHHPLGRLVVGQPLPRRGQHLAVGAAGGEDQEDVAEPLLVGPVGLAPAPPAPRRRHGPFRTVPTGTRPPPGRHRPPVRRCADGRRAPRGPPPSRARPGPRRPGRPRPPGSGRAARRRRCRPRWGGAAGPQRLGGRRLGEVVEPGQGVLGVHARIVWPGAARSGVEGTYAVRLGQVRGLPAADQPVDHRVRYRRGRAPVARADDRRRRLQRDDLDPARGSRGERDAQLALLAGDVRWRSTRTTARPAGAPGPARTRRAATGPLVAAPGRTPSSARSASRLTTGRRAALAAIQVSLPTPGSPDRTVTVAGCRRTRRSADRARACGSS